MTKTRRGISRKTVEEISEIKGEPDWMRKLRLKAYQLFVDMNLPDWGPSKQLHEIDFDDLHYFIRPGEKLARSWDDVPKDIRAKYDELGIPDGEKEYLAGVGAQFESEMVYHSLHSELADRGIIFEDMSVALKKYPDLFKEYFGSVISNDNNKFSALNGAVWSGGSFVYIPPNVYLDVPLHNFFQMGTPAQGQFERTLIIADEGSTFEFIEGCVAPLYSETSIHAGVVEIVVKRGARVKYSTMQNWSKNVMNLVTKSAYVHEEGEVEWVDGNVGSGVTMKYPSMILAGPKAKGQLISLAICGDGQVIDSGGKGFHLASETSMRVESKSVVKGTGRSTFRGEVLVQDGAENCRSGIECVSLHLSRDARSDTYPSFEIDDSTAVVEHESSIMKLKEEQVMYLQSRGLTEEVARGMIIGGFIDDFTSSLPMEYAVEFDRLVELEIKNGIG